MQLLTKQTYFIPFVLVNHLHRENLGFLVAPKTESAESCTVHPVKFSWLISLADSPSPPVVLETRWFPHPLGGHAFHPHPMDQLALEHRGHPATDRLVNTSVSTEGTF